MEADTPSLTLNKWREEALGLESTGDEEALRVGLEAVLEEEAAGGEEEEELEELVEFCCLLSPGR